MLATFHRILATCRHILGTYVSEAAAAAEEEVSAFLALSTWVVAEPEAASMRDPAGPDILSPPSSKVSALWVERHPRSRGRHNKMFDVIVGSQSLTPASPTGTVA